LTVKEVLNHIKTKRTQNQDTIYKKARLNSGQMEYLKTVKTFMIKTTK